MRVELINKEEVKDLFKNHGEFACTCYDTPKKFAKGVGKSCNESNHMSGSIFLDFHTNPPNLIY